MQPIRKLRLEMGYSIAEMAESLGFGKATFQGYDNGTRAAPEGLLDRMKAIQQANAAFMAGIAERVDERLKEDRSDMWVK